jgi:hypothetical protein
MLSTQIRVRSSSPADVRMMEYSFEPNKTTVRDMLRDVRMELKIQNVSLSSCIETILTANEIHYEYVGGGLADGAVVQLVLPDNKNDSPRLFEIKSQKSLGNGTFVSSSLNVFNSWKGIDLVQKSNVKEVLLKSLQVRIDVNTTMTVAEIKDELLKSKKGMGLGSDYKICLRSEDGEQWDETYESSDTLVVDTSLPGPLIYAHLIPVFDICVSTLTGKKVKLQVAASRHTVYDLKRLVEAREGIPPDQQRLVCGGEQLDDKFTLGHYNIGTKSQVHLILRLRGGMYHETSSRKDFAKLAEQKEKLLSVNLLLPGGKESLIHVSHYDTVDRLRELAIVKCEGRPQSRKETNLEAALEVTEDRIKRLRCELYDAELEKERLLRSKASSKENHE